MTSRDCWRINFDSRMWQSPLRQKLQEKESALLSSSPNPLPSAPTTFESYTIYLVSRTAAVRVCFLHSLHRGITKSYRCQPVPFFIFWAAIGWLKRCNGQIEPFAYDSLPGQGSKQAARVPCSLGDIKLNINLSRQCQKSHPLVWLPNILYVQWQN